MNDLLKLARSLELTAKAVEANAVEAVKTVSRNVGVMVIFATPVDTSRARMNWQSSVDFPATGVLSPYPDKPADPSVGPNVAMKSLKDAISKYTGQSSGVFIANNVNYISVLNDGSSDQAPANFVAKAVIAAVESTKNVKLLP